MSKLEYSSIISEKMYGVGKSLFYGCANHILNYDQEYMLALCIAYLTLSKEKIIDKDKDNNDKLGRLTKHVNTSDIDTIFDSSFSSKMPVIIEADSLDKTWILDNFRDSIMHGVFDIDLINQELIIDNNGYDRRLKATIPFEWLFKYAKYDINSKKIKDFYSVKGLFYNDYLNNKKKYYLDTTLNKSIFYSVYIKGNRFNVKDVENKIRELFIEYSKEPYSDNPIYENTYKKYNYYDKEYFYTFLTAREKITQIMKKEFGVDVSIEIIKNKSEILKKAKNKIKPYTYDYDYLYKNLNNLCIKKSDKMLNMLSLIIDNIGKDIKLDNETFLSNFEEVLMGNNGLLTNDIDSYNMNRLMLANLIVTVTGISTFVINKEELEKKIVNNDYLQYFNTYSRPVRMNEVAKLKKLKNRLLTLNNQYNIAKSQIANCSNEKGKKFLNNRINDLRKEMIKTSNDYLKLNRHETREFDLDNKAKKEVKNLRDEKDFWEAFEDIAESLYNKFDIEYERENYDYYDKEIEEIQKKYKFSKCDDELDKLTVIRNSLSHIGRINTIKLKNNWLGIEFFDYDDNNHLSGYSYCKYNEFFGLICRLFEEEKVKVIK